MASPAISVAVPVRNGWHALPATLESIVRTRAYDDPLEIVVADDASDPPAPRAQLRAAAAALAGRTRIRVVTSPQRLGVAGARNLACTRASGEILVITDAHVAFTPGWDRVIRESVAPASVLAGAVSDPTSRFVGYGCTLVVPFMGTHWCRRRPEPGAPVQIASSAATALTAETFAAIGGFDAGMMIYGAAEPEFSVRAWLSGAEVLTCPDFVVSHRFKTAPERRSWIGETRPYMLHNCMRFGLLYLDETAALRMMRHLCTEFPNHAAIALRALAAGDVWERRRALRERLEHDFAWFVDRFRLNDQTGMPLYAGADRRD